jgi:hypothetical protein
MERGDVTVHGTFWRWMLYGRGWQDCWYRSGGEENEEVLVPSSSSRPALRCPRCWSVVIPGNSHKAAAILERALHSPGEVDSADPDRGPAIEDRFGEASRLAYEGELAQALKLYEELTTELNGAPDGVFAQNCADELRQKLA